jgi:hypothetical protein
MVSNINHPNGACIFEGEDYIWIDFVQILVNHRITKGIPKTGARVYIRAPVFGDSFNFRDLLNLITVKENSL